MVIQHHQVLAFINDNLSTDVDVIPPVFQNLYEAQLLDADCQKIMDGLAAHIPKVVLRYALHHNVLVSKASGWCRPFIPRSYVPQPLREFYESPVVGGHLGFSIMFAKLSSRYYWPRMKQDIVKFIETCGSCISLRRDYHRTYGLIGHLDIPDVPLTFFALDIMGPLLLTAHKTQYINSAVCLLSRYLECAALSSITASDVADFVERRIYLRFGTPSLLLTNNGTNFVSQLFTRHASLFRVPLRTIAPYNSRGNGIVESSHLNIASMLKHYVQEKHSLWDLYLPAVTFATTQASMGL